MATAMAIQISQRPPTGVDRPEPVCCSTLGIACSVAVPGLDILDRAALDCVNGRIV
jgi:hypothetical protein